MKRIPRQEASKETLKVRANIGSTNCYLFQDDSLGPDGVTDVETAIKPATTTTQCDSTRYGTEDEKYYSLYCSTKVDTADGGVAFYPDVGSLRSCIELCSAYTDRICRGVN